MHDTDGAARRPKTLFFRAQIARKPAGWLITPLEGDIGLFERIWGGPVAGLTEAERHVHPELAEADFKKMLASVARDWGLALRWLSLVQFELREPKKRRPAAPAYRAGAVNNLCELAEDACEGIEDWRAMSEPAIAAALERLVYKGTECGAWFNVLRDARKAARGVQVGSIVEGIEPTTETHTLMFPFEPGAFRRALDEVEAEAAELWNATHGCPQCWQGPKNDEGWPVDEAGEELDEWPVDPQCAECGGHGRII